MKPRTAVSRSGPPNAFTGLPASVKYAIGIVGTMLLLGFVFSIANFPSDIIGGPSTNSIVSKAVEEVKVLEKESVSLSKKLLQWMPLHHWVHIPNHKNGVIVVDEEVEEAMPDYKSFQFWSPIDIDTVPYDPIVTLCQLNFQEYSESPHMYPMFRDLETLSHCHGHKRTESLSNLLQEIKSNKDNLNGRVISPSGFVFHESRVGSTLVANSLGSDPWNLVYSESSPSANALLHCDGCDEQRAIQLFRDVVTIMGRTPFHKRLFLKFQSITSTKMDIALKAFPNTSWAFIYRSPVQTMMSHLDPKKGVSGAPCLRSMRDPPAEVQNAIDSLPGRKTPPREAWCAAHLNMLCSNAIAAYKAHGKFAVHSTDIIQSQQQRGLLVNYESLPGSIPRLMLPLFGVRDVSTRWLHKMGEESSYYSKGRQSVRSFTGDSEDKEQRATSEIQDYAHLLLANSFEEMEAASYSGVRTVLTDLINSNSQRDSINSPQLLLQAVTSITRAEKDIGRVSAYSWKALSPLPTRSSRKKVGNQVVEGSSNSHEESTTAIADSSSSAVTGRGNDNSIGSDSTTAVPGNNNGHYQHSTSFKLLPYQPWAPFANTHSSVPFNSLRNPIDSSSSRTSDCPSTPAKGYPEHYQLRTVIKNWNPDSTDIPIYHYDSLCHFDYSNRDDNAKAWNYRDAEVPFVLYNVPDVDRVVKRWSNVDYLAKKLGTHLYTTEVSKDNHFMYHRDISPRHLRGSISPHLRNYVAPTNTTHTTYETWLENAVKAQNKTLPDRKHEYFRVSSNLDGGNQWLFDELPMFKPKKSLFLTDPDGQQGIHCRFGMRSVIAEPHFDGSRNTIAMISGLRRWIIAHPSQCKHMELLPHDHPSARHASFDWSDPTAVDEHAAEFDQLRALEVILQPGDVLYLPTFWIHYIVSLNVNVQCNSRSGASDENRGVIEECNSMT